MENGYFIDSKREYVITNMYPKRPLMNYIWNEQIMIDIDQFGFGPFEAFDEKRQRRNIYADKDQRNVYLLDKSSLEYYSANRNYEKKPFDRFETHVGQGYSVIISEYKGLRFELKIFAPTVGTAECWEIKLKNLTDKKKSLYVYPAANIRSCITGHCAYIKAAWDEALQGLISTEEGYDLDREDLDVYMCSDRKALEWDTASQSFIGVYNNASNPVALENGGKLSSFGTCFQEFCTFVLKHDIDLEANEETVIRVIVGLAKNKTHAMNEKNRILSKASFDEALLACEKKAEAYDERILINTGDETIDRFTNIWLKRQIDFGKTWARGYAIGSRDMMQDVMGFVSLDVEVSKQKLLYAMPFVRPNGNIIRLFVPIVNILSHDCSTWMISAVCQYIKESGDFSILDIDCPYYESDEHGTVLDHLLRASGFLLDGTGEHGLTLWGECDWNDSMNGAGMNLKGESVWLSEASINCNNDLIQLLRQIGKHDLADSIQAKCDVMKENILKYGLDGDHFIYGINDIGEKIGAYENDEAKIYLNPQTWAVIAGILPKNDLHVLMDYVEDKLCCDYGYVQLTPPYTKPDPNVGRITYFQKGCYENASVYNHGCAFKLVADCYLNRGNEALKTIKLMLPTNPQNTSEISGMEPYAISNMYIGPDNEYISGFSPAHWITGTCGWLFRGITEYMIGIQAEYNGLKIAPSLPEEWKTVKVKRTFRGAVYDISIEQKKYNGALTIYLDGQKIEGNLLPIFNDHSTHKVSITVG